MRMSYYTIDGGRLAGLPGPAFMEWDFARLRKMGFGVVVSLECDRLNTFEIEDAGFEHKKICVEDFASPTFDQIDEFVAFVRSEEHTSELQSRENLVCRLLLEKENYLSPICSRAL